MLTALPRHVLTVVGVPIEGKVRGVSHCMQVPERGAARSGHCQEQRSSGSEGGELVQDDSCGKVPVLAACVVLFCLLLDTDCIPLDQGCNPCFHACASWGVHDTVSR